MSGVATHLKPQATAVMPTSECEVMTGTSLSRPIIRGFSSSAICHEFLILARGGGERGSLGYTIIITTTTTKYQKHEVTLLRQLHQTAKKEHPKRDFPCPLAGRQSTRTPVGDEKEGGGERATGYLPHVSFCNMIASATLTLTACIWRQTLLQYDTKK